MSETLSCMSIKAHKLLAMCVLGVFSIVFAGIGFVAGWMLFYQEYQDNVMHERSVAHQAALETEEKMMLDLKPLLGCLKAMPEKSK